MEAGTKNRSENIRRPLYKVWGKDRSSWGNEVPQNPLATPMGRNVAPPLRFDAYNRAPFINLLVCSDPKPALLNGTDQTPACRYDVLKDSVDGQPVKYANLGDVLVHKWSCETGTTPQRQLQHLPFSRFWHVGSFLCGSRCDWQRIFADRRARVTLTILGRENGRCSCCATWEERNIVRQYRCPWKHWFHFRSQYEPAAEQLCCSYKNLSKN